MKKLSNINRKKFFLNIVIPTLLTQALFVILIFAVVIPNFRHNLIEAKKEMIMEIINSSICIADKYYKDAVNNEISFEEAQSRAISAIESIRYGTANKDYIWITDEEPNMIMHPYRKDLIGKNLEDFTDEKGNKMFLEMVNKVEESGEGYVDYMWQWMDDPSKIVPKISYIKEYPKWDWILGTGVYIEDVRSSIRSVINSLLWISFGIFVATSFLLVLIVRRNLKVEHQRTLAEFNLKESNEKYKALVEASNDGTLMFIDNKCIFRNKKIDEMINCDNNEKISPDLQNIIADNLKDDIDRINLFLNDSSVSFQLETKIINRNNQQINVLITLSKISFSENKGLIVIIKDLTPDPEDPALDIIISDIMANISRDLNIGIFRATPGRKGSLTEVNQRFLNILEYESLNQITSVNIYNLFDDTLEKKKFVSYLNANGFINDFECKIIKGNGDIASIIINAVIVKGEDNSIDYIDGFITDNTRSKYFDDANKMLLSRYIHQSSLWDMPATTINSKDIPKCSNDCTVKNALELMDFYSTDILLLENDITPLIISKDKIISLMNKTEFSFDKKINIFSEIPDRILSTQTTVIECLFNMLRDNKNYALINQPNDYKIIRLKDILTILYSNTAILEKRLLASDSMEEIIDIHNSLPLYIKYFVDAGTDINIITKTITSVSDNISELIIPMAINQVGEPPCKFAFIALGSEGRAEQGLSTDQDNAIIYEDMNNNVDGGNNQYFLKLADIINNLLHKAGYKLCEGEIMANNSKWNQPLSVWKKYFYQWITVPEPQNLIDSSIFFDFRYIYGDKHFADELRKYINTLISNNPAFIKQNAIMTVNYKLPLGMFGKIQTEIKKEKQEGFNLKNAIRLLVNTVRLYAMEHFIDETNTLVRLEYLTKNNHISNSFYLEIKYCFKFLMNIQFKYQTESYSHGLQPGNYLDLSLLTEVELNNLKNVLGIISSFQTKVKYDYRITAS